jgi:hypothetical protein
MVFEWGFYCTFSVFGFPIIRPGKRRGVSQNLPFTQRAEKIGVE